MTSLKIPRRKIIRLNEYDYSQEGSYFITVCAQGRKCLFGHVVNDEVQLNAIGEMVVCQWVELVNRFSHISLDEYIVMPNHLHGIIHIGVVERATTSVAPTIGYIVGAFKSITTLEYMKGIALYNWPAFQKKIWQRNYYEHVIRSEESLEEIRDYVVNNASNWEKDELFSEIL